MLDPCPGGGGLDDFWIKPSMGVDVTIGEGDDAPVVMVGSREVEVGVTVSIAGHDHDERRRAEALGAEVHEEEGAGRLDDVGGFAKDAVTPTHSAVHGGVRIEEEIHGVTANLGYRTAPVIEDTGFVRWTFVRLLGGQVRRERGIPGIDEVGRIGEGRCEVVVIAQNPEAGRIGVAGLLVAVLNERLVGVGTVESPGCGQLSLVVDALNPMGRALGTAQRRKQNRCENCNDGDHHQKLDQGEGW